MPNVPANLVYPFDPSGSLASNRISAEQQVLTGSNFRDFYFIVPKLAPFFASSLVISFRATNGEVRPLAAGIDYYCTHQFISASRACASPIFGSITFLDLQLIGVVSLTYQTIGGDWVISDTAIAEILADRLHNPRITAWDVVTEYPATFPVVDHEWDLVDLVGASDVVTALNGINNTLLLRVNQIANQAASYSAAEIDAKLAPLQAHVAAMGNPHHTTATDVDTFTKTETTILINTAVSNLPAQEGGTPEDEQFFLIS